jgi:hypothetical protein
VIVLESASNATTVSLDDDGVISAH